MVRFICNSVFLDFVRRLYVNKITTFRKLNLLPSSGKKGRTKTPALGPSFFYLKTEEDPASETL
jgi:hypothetical protein